MNRDGTGLKKITGNDVDDEKPVWGLNGIDVVYSVNQETWEAANVCLDTHGGYGFATEYDVERKFRETRLFTVAPVTNNLVLAYLGHNVLGLPRSY